MGGKGLLGRVGPGLAHKSAVAVATVVLFGTISMFFYPLLYQAGWIDMDTRAFGIFLGGAVHEVAQVVASASNIDPATTEIATIVKMTRVALLAEQQHHHPKWSNVWNTVEIWLSTHDAGNVVTEKDHALAKAIDGLV